MDYRMKLNHQNLRGRGGAGFPTGLKMVFCTQKKLVQDLII